jgi:hypothetical protein
MFEDLDTIEWHKLQHAYGSAEDIPNLIRSLVSEDEKTRKKALGDLYFNIYHQGSIYEPASYAVPFFVEILESPDAKDKAELLFYLQHLAHAGSYANSHKGFSFIYSAEKLASEEFKNQLNTELSWVDLTHNAVLKHQDVYIHLMETSQESAVRCRAVGLLASFGELRTSLLPRLLEQLKRETELEVQTIIIDNLWKFIATSDEENIKLIMAHITDKNDKLIRIVTAQTITRIYREDTPDHVIKILSDSLTPIADLDLQYWNLTWTNSNQIFPILLQSLCLIKWKEARKLVPQILDIIEATNLRWLNSRYLMYLLFGSEKLGTGTTVHDLDDLQVRALRLMDKYAEANDGAKAIYWQEIGRNLNRYGLPLRPKELSDFLKG